MIRSAKFIMLLALLAAPAARAADKADPDLPQPLDPKLATPLLESSPFTRSLNLSDSLVLTGIAYIQGKPVATILDKASKSTYVVSGEPNAQGWKLAETNASGTLSRTQAKIMIGNEIVTVRYAQEQISPEDMKKSVRTYSGDRGGDRPPDAPRRDYPRPSDEDRQRFMALSAEAKGKFMEAMHESREKMQNATPEERQAYARKMFEKIEKADQKK